MPKYTGELDWKVVDIAPKAEGELPAVHVVGHKGGQPVEPGPAWRYGPATEQAARDQAQAVADARNARESLIRDRGGVRVMDAEAAAAGDTGIPRPFAVHEAAAAANPSQPAPATLPPGMKSSAHATLVAVPPKREG